ncbi:hypothetical protein BDZ91DRAFT_742064 [Kalaharituber pfeilii]|nr:hypothetical protein BDZ91DRAFT_742064 [Kalaharituber pfeilii]
MNNPFEVESCILHHLIKLHSSTNKPTRPSISNLPATLPPPSIFTSLYTDGGTSDSQETAPQNISPNPTVAECAVHLELLEAFLVLKRRVLKSNALDYTFGTRRVPPQRRTDPNWLQKRKEKWDKFLDLAVLRFEVWWEEMAKKIGKGDLMDDENHLPPLDVLMVWHTYMLKPQVYRLDLRKKLGMLGDEELCNCAKFPWKAIHEAINHETRAYTLTAGQKRQWEKITAMPDNLFDFLSDYGQMHDETLGILARGSLDFPQRELKPGYFEQFLMQPGEKELIQLYLKKDSWCFLQMSDDFRWSDGREQEAHGVTKDLPKLMLDKFPRGSPPRMAKYISPIFQTAFVVSGTFCPARSLYEFRQKILAAPNNAEFFRYNDFSKEDDLQGVLDTIHWLFKTYTRKGYISGPSMDLKAAVQRQDSFVEKMGNFLWIRSPYLEGTLSRALTRYWRFLDLLRLRHNPKQSTSGKQSTTARPPVVPAIDIDIVWHTHLLDPAGYYICCIKNVGKFVNHNDDLEQDVLRTGWELTKKVYWKKYGVVYGACFCWVCEGIKSKSEAIMKGKTQRKVDWDVLGKEVKEEVEYWRMTEMDRRRRS